MQLASPSVVVCTVGLIILGMVTLAAGTGVRRGREQPALDIAAAVIMKSGCCGGFFYWLRGHAETICSYSWMQVISEGV